MAAVFGNVYNKTEISQKLLKAFAELDDILVHIAGPFASNVIIGSKWRQHNDVDEFTKDGIKVLAHLFASEEADARLAARLARFVGFTVDKRCHDGTTTAMLMFCRLARLALKYSDTPVFERKRFSWFKDLMDNLDKIRGFVDSMKIMPDDILKRAKELGVATTLPEVRAAIAYHMAMISSKGDHDLATKISYVVKSNPKTMYGVFTPSGLNVETVEPYILERQDYDFAVQANLYNLNDFNYKNDTQYLSENAVVFFCGSEIARGSMEAVFLNAFISQNPRHRADLAMFNSTVGWEDLHQGKRNLIIVAPDVTDPDLQSNIILFNRENPTIKISSFTALIAPQVRTSTNKAIHYMSGVPTFLDTMYSDPVKSLIGLSDDHPVRVHLLRDRLAFYNLYQRDGQVFHPYYEDPAQYDKYTEFLKELEGTIELGLENITNSALASGDITYLTSIYRNYTCQDIYSVQVGGSAHEQLANRTVYEDAMGAALSAVDEGVVLGGYGHILNYVYSMDKSEQTEGLAQVLLSVLSDTLRVEDREFVDSLCGTFEPKWSYLVADPDAYRNNTGKYNYIYTGELDEDTLRYFLSRSPGRPILTQAWSGYHEQFKRFRSFLPMLANTSHLADQRTRENDNLN